MTPIRHYFYIAGITAFVFLAALLVLPVSISLELGKDTSPEPQQEEYLESEEAVFVLEEKEGSSQLERRLFPVRPTLFRYIEVTDSCGPDYEGDCLNARSGPGTDFDIVRRLRNGVVLKIGGAVEREGRTWYKVVFDEHIRYPWRLEGDWYVAADYVRVLLDEGHRDLTDGEDIDTDKRIVVDRSDQMLYAYEGEELFMEKYISTGVELTPTPRGTFTIFRKTPSRYMQGPLPGISSDYYDLPGVPWNLYFTKQGAVIHGAYWHDKFGQPWSHGCVNLPLSSAEELYIWADLGTTVVVRD